MANKPTIYKRIQNTSGSDRTYTALSSDEQTKVSSVISNFITYFKAKHL
jgi:hypothetical protein